MRCSWPVRVGQGALPSLFTAVFPCLRFDGSGGDNDYDAGSCVDGRLTSAWNWCSKVRSIWCRLKIVLMLREFWAVRVEPLEVEAACIFFSLSVWCLEVHVYRSFLEFSLRKRPARIGKPMLGKDIVMQWKLYTCDLWHGLPPISTSNEVQLAPGLASSTQCSINGTE